MALRGLVRQAREAWQVPRDLLLRRYPGFVTGGDLPRGHVPVFVFHTLEPEPFERKLRYLADNGYETLSADAYYGILLKARPAPQRAVLLSFDDGRASVFSVGYPLMRRFGMKALVFLVPARIEPRPPRPEPTATSARALPVPEPSEGFLCWDEVAALERSGLFDFHSHTLSHARIHTAPLLEGFLSPELRRGYRVLDAPRIHEGGRDLEPGEIPLGTPLLRSEPRTGEALRFFEDPEIRRACLERVAADGEGFFHRQGWREELLRMLRKGRITGRYETPEQREAEIRHELASSKSAIEARTGRPVTHLCYPWHVSGPTARRLARELGYRTAFCGMLPGVPITLPGGDPLAIARVGEDWVEALPGRGRADISAILRAKWKRRLGGGT